LDPTPVEVQPTVPKDGVVFYSPGSWGSKVFDSLGGSELAVYVCDTCLRNKSGEVLYVRECAPAPHFEVKTFEPGLDR
jgi:hypothetical protein